MTAALRLALCACARLETEVGIPRERHEDVGTDEQRGGPECLREFDESEHCDEVNKRDEQPRAIY